MGDPESPKRTPLRAAIVSKPLVPKVWPMPKPKQQQKRGQGLLVLLYSFSRNTFVLIDVYLSFNLAAASALRSKIHSTARGCCDVSKTLTFIDRKTKYPKRLPEVVWRGNHGSFYGKRGEGDVLVWRGVTLRQDEVPSRSCWTWISCPLPVITAGNNGSKFS